MAGRIYELVPAISGTLRRQYHAALSIDRQCDSSGCVRECRRCYRYALRRCLLDRSLGNPGLQWLMASLGGSQRSRLLSRHGHGTGALCSPGDLRLHSLSSIYWKIDWKRRLGLADWGMTSVIVS